MNMQELEAIVLASDFDIDVHKHVFINYLEVMIDPEGVAHYAIPSHQEWLCQYIMQKDGITREQLYKKYEKHPYDFMDNMLKDYHCLAVWNDFFIGSPNTKQRQTMEKLVKAGLYEDSLQNFSNS